MISKIENKNKSIFVLDLKSRFFFFAFLYDNNEVCAMNDPSPDLIKDARIHQELNSSHLSYEELFRRLNKNQDGHIEVDELINLLEKVGVETSSKKRWAIARVSEQFTLNSIESTDFKSCLAYYRSGRWITERIGYYIQTIC